jgi:glycine C-acetyltransferase
MVDTFSKLPEVSSAGDKVAAEHLLTLESPQAGTVMMDGRPVVMLGSNNYLGLANHPKVIEKAKAALDRLGGGTGMNPVLCTTPVHRELEEAMAEFTQCEKVIMFNSCTAANAALVPTLMGADDVIFSDQYNHASIIDACRLSRATTKVFSHLDVAALKTLLERAQDARLRLIISDGVFSMEGDTIPLPEVMALAEEYSAIVAIDEAHATGVIGETGKGTPEYYDVMGQVDIQTGTFGKALGAAGGGYVAGSKGLIDFLFANARFFIFTSAMNPVTTACALAALQVLREEPGLVQKLWDNTKQLRKGLKEMGFTLLGSGESPITPILVGEASAASEMGSRLFEQGVYIPGLGFPIVPKGMARLRAQPSAAHSSAEIQRALDAIETVGKQLNVIS